MVWSHFLCLYRKPSFYVRRLRSFSTAQFLIEPFVFCFILPYILYCSPVVLCGLLSKDWKIISRCVCVLSVAVFLWLDCRSLLFRSVWTPENSLQVKYSQMFNILYIHFCRILACLVLVVLCTNIFIHVLMLIKTQLFLTLHVF